MGAKDEIEEGELIGGNGLRTLPGKELTCAKDSWNQTFCRWC